MGVDFLNRMKRTYTRTLDRRAVALRSPRLFDADMACVNRTARGKIKHDAKPTEGERVMVREIEGKFVAQRGCAVVIELEKPPADYVEHIRRGGGIAEGTVSIVNPISQTAEVSICE
jgi:hypothetical protein